MLYYAGGAQLSNTFCSGRIFKLTKRGVTGDKTHNFIADGDNLGDGVPAEMPGVLAVAAPAGPIVFTGWIKIEFTEQFRVNGRRLFAEGTEPAGEALGQDAF